MIYIGQNNDRAGIIRAYAEAHGLQKVVLFGDMMEGLQGLNINAVPYNKVIEYAYYYKYLAFTDKQTLFVWNDCLRKRDQRALEYNCIRHCAEQTKHRLIFNTLPIIETREDFMILYTLLEPNTFVRLAFSDVDSFKNVDIAGFHLPLITIDKRDATNEQWAKYQRLKDEAISAVKRDPNIIPRRLLKYAETIAKSKDSKVAMLPHDMTVTDTGLPVDAYYIARLQKIQKENAYVASKV